MSNNNNQLNIPQAKEAMNKFKMQAASEVGVNLTNGYNGHLTSREAGSVGGQMVKKAVRPNVRLLQALFVSLNHLLDHLAADGAGFPGGQVAVVAVGQVDAHFLGSLHLEAVHSLTGLGNVQLVVVRVAHIESLLCFLRKDNAFRRKHFLFRTYSLTKVESCMNVNWRKNWKNHPLRFDE